MTINSKKLYHYATSKNDYLKKIKDEISKEILINNYSSYEGHGILKELKERETENIEVVEGATKKELVSSIEELLVKKIRPELIDMALKEYINNQRIDIKVRRLVLDKLDNCVRDFDNAYKKIINDLRNSQKMLCDIYTDDYNDSPAPTGLGFDIITNQVSSALIYQAMQKNEVERQLRNQRVIYENNVARSTGEEVSKKVEKVEKIYTEFGDAVFECIDYLFNSEKSENMRRKTIIDNKSNVDAAVLTKEINESVKEILKLNKDNKIKLRANIGRNGLFETEGEIKEIHLDFFLIKKDKETFCSSYMYQDLFTGNLEIEFEDEESNKKLRDLKEKFMT